MPRSAKKSLINTLTAFCTGFVLGAAFMASPAVGLALAALAIAYLFIIHLRT